VAKIAVLHTSFVFVNVELRVQQLLDELLPDDEIIHFVDSDVLATVVREGGISADSEQRMVLLAEAAERAGADVIFSACSSLGPTLDAARKAVDVPIVKIDDAMAEYAAARASRIGVLATVPTTLGPTADLIRAHATGLGRDVQVVQHLCEGAFETLMGGDKAAHDEMVLVGAREFGTGRRDRRAGAGVDVPAATVARGERRDPDAVQPSDGHQHAGRRRARCPAPVTAELLDTRDPVLAGTLLDGLPSVRVVPGALELIRVENERTGTRVAVLDDDPTGTQPVAGVPVLTSWSVTGLRWAIARGPGMFFVLTNTRSVSPELARARNAEIAANLAAAAAAEGGVPVRLISRCDSTLRGHYPLETDVHRAAAEATGQPYDGVLFSLAYLAAGRITVNDVHWTRRGEQLVPVATTEYARDATFGYRSSNLRAFVQEKTGGHLGQEDVLSLDLGTIRSGGPAAVRELLLRVRDGQPVIVNAAEEEDLEVVVLGLQLAEREGRRFLHRSGPSLGRTNPAQVRAGSTRAVPGHSAPAMPRQALDRSPEPSGSSQRR